MSIYLSISLSLYLSISIYRSCLSIYLSIHPSIPFKLKISHYIPINQRFPPFLCWWHRSDHGCRLLGLATQLQSSFRMPLRGGQRHLRQRKKPWMFIIEKHRMYQKYRDVCHQIPVIGDEVLVYDFQEKTEWGIDSKGFLPRVIGDVNKFMVIKWDM